MIVLNRLSSHEGHRVAAWRPSALGIIGELGEPLDYFVDATKLSFKALRIEITTSQFSAIALSITPILQPVVEALWDYTIKGGILSGALGSFAQVVGSGLGSGEGELLRGEGGPKETVDALLRALEAAAKRLPETLGAKVDVATRLLRFALEENNLPLLQRLKDAAKKHYADIVGDIFGVIDDKVLGQAISRLLSLGGNDVDLLNGISPSKSGVYSVGNGPAMRAAILGATIDDVSNLLEFVRSSSRLTHTDPKAEFGAVAIALAAREASLNDNVDANRWLEVVSRSTSGDASELLELLKSAVASVATGHANRFKDE